MLFDDDPTVRQFTFNYSADLDFCGASSKDYTITVIGTAGEEVTETSASPTFVLTVKNPCIDSDYLVINKAPLPVGKQYILHDNTLNIIHDPFTIVTSPITHTLCGDLYYTATFNGDVADLTTLLATGMQYVRFV